MTPVLSARALGRATLSRQLLLERAEMSPLAAIERLAGLQAQTPHTWYVGLWGRLRNFAPEEVSALLLDRKVVRIAAMRSTIHLLSATDALAFRSAVQPWIERATEQNYGKNLVGVDYADLEVAGRALVAAEPRTFSQLGQLLAEKWPDRDPASLAQTIRSRVALVQVPPRGVWRRSGLAKHTSVEEWLGASLPVPDVGAMLLRYLAAFGPASVADMQTWCGLSRLGEVVAEIRNRLIVFRDENGRELFDLPDAPRPDPDTPAPARLLYDYDNIFLSHADRSRIVVGHDFADLGYVQYGPVPRPVLLDGVISGAWVITKSKGEAVLTVQPFRKPSATQRTELSREAASLLEFLEPKAVHDVRIDKPPQI